METGKKHQLELRIRNRIRNELIISAMNHVPREKFVPLHYQAFAYDDMPLSIGESQTISQPSLVALMTEKLNLTKISRVLEIGTGSGYQTAILAELAGEVFTVEVRKRLSEQAQDRLKDLSYKNIHFKIGNGMLGWREEAPFDAIIVTAAAQELPDEFIDQLKVDGRIVIPLQVDHSQELFLLTKTLDGMSSEPLVQVRFVPIVTDDPANN